MSKLYIGNNYNSFIGFIETHMKTVNQHALCKQKHIQGNHLSFLNKTMSKEIMTRRRNRFIENRNNENIYEAYETTKLLFFS